MIGENRPDRERLCIMGLINQEDNIFVVAGPCAVESERQTLATARSVSWMQDIVEPFQVTMGFRGGAWKPRTEYRDRNANKVFEGTREEGLAWLARAGSEYQLPVFSECMSEQDLRHFGRLLNFERDYIQVGARTSKAYALLHAIGGEPFGVLLKSPEHGVRAREAVGSLSRMAKNRDMDLLYCIRGQHHFLDPDCRQTSESELYNRPTQHADSRNLNNVGQIKRLRESDRAREFFGAHSVRTFFDPSHTFGGANDETRRMIGRFAVEAVTNPDYRYDGILLEVNDRPDLAKCDGAQALLSSSTGVDWSRTNAGQMGCVEAAGGEKPAEGHEPLTLVDILCKIIEYQAKRLDSVDQKEVAEAQNELQEIKWQNWA
ncbi:MAG: hypothetical protein ACLFT2_04835 [Candidatus Brocadiia bacterium]